MSNGHSIQLSNNYFPDLKFYAPANCATSSPWLDKSKPNLFQYEFQIAKENSSFPGYRPEPLYRWIYCNGGIKLFFRALARYAPMFPVYAYGGQVVSWISPPPSGLGNVIFIVIGHDQLGELRLVGGNYFSFPRPYSGEVPNSGDFFGHYDEAGCYARQRLVTEVIEKSAAHNNELLSRVFGECEHFHTMPICIVALTKRGPLFHTAKAVIEGVKAADFSHEYFGEIK
jgi:hypothetical protein